MKHDALRLGLDIGSTTVKAVLMEPEHKTVLFSRYARHNACQVETVRTFLADMAAQFPGAAVRAAVCGSGGKPIAEALGVPFVQEVVANAVAVRTFYPEARVAIELGGQDAKIVFFYYDRQSQGLAASDMRMNGSCAGGTGAFIDEIAALLRIPVEEFEALAAKGTSVYEISGRCGVFAKTDIQPLLNQGGLHADIALSTFHAIAKQTIGGLAQGLELTPPIIFEGGPLTFNPTLIKVFAQRLGLSGADCICPPNPETLIAYGAALSLDALFPDQTRELDLTQGLAALAAFRAGLDQREAGPRHVFFANPAEREDFERRHKMPETLPHTGTPGKPLKVYVGIDAGSTTSKLALVDEEERVIDRFYAHNQGEPLRVMQKALLDLKRKYDEAGTPLEILAIGTTGYGELLFDKAFGADYHTVETVAHAAAAQKYAPQVSFVLDIGGQDMKAISISGGVVTNITVNEACSSGCGSFLENFGRNLNIPLERISHVAFSAAHPAELGSRCTVFMNSAVITEQKNGKQPEDIMAGLCRSIIENVFTKVVRISNPAALGDHIVVQGGTFKNDAVLRALEQYLGKPVVRAPYPGEMGAIGIALLTKREIAENGFSSPHGPPDKTRFIGFDALERFGYTQESNVTCPFCGNHCSRILVRFSNGATWVTGNRCERGEILGDPKDPALREKVTRANARMAAVPDMVALRETLLFKDYPVTALAPDRNCTIGLPRVLDFWRTMPFFTTFFHALGFKTKISRPSSHALFERGLPFVASDTVCFPAKLVHGHLHDLAEATPEAAVDRVFLPLFCRLPSENPEPQSTYTCPVLKGYPLVVKYSEDPARRWKLPLDTPVFHWLKKRDRNLQLCRYMRETFGVPEALCRKAITQGDAALAAFNAELVREGARIIAQAEQAGTFAVVLAGRHYQFDTLVNHQLSRYFTGMGIPVITVDALPGVQEVDLSKTRLDITNNNHARLLAGAIITAEHPALEYVEMFSFGCGHDALYADEVSRLLQAISGKSPLILKLDESDISGPLRIRVRSFIETVRIRRKKQRTEGLAATLRPLSDPYPVKFVKQDKSTKTVLIPNVSQGFCKIITAALKQVGLKAEALPLGGKAAMRYGKQYVHNDSCFPAQMIIGEAIAALKSGRYDPAQVVVGTGKTLCDCRLVNYMALTRSALDEAGYPETPILSTDFFDAKNMHPGFRFSKLTYARMAWCLMMTDVLEDLRRKIRPYELIPGETNRVVDGGIDAICAALQHGGMLAALEAYKKAVSRVAAVRYDRSVRKHQVFITGEYLLTFHPGSNYHIEAYLERHNMEVILPRMFDIYRNLMLFHTISEIKDFKVRHSLGETLYAFGGDAYSDFALDIIEKIACAHPFYEPALRLPQMAALSDPIIHRSIQSGEGFIMAADLLHHAAQGVRSFVILQPFGCLPNHVCGRGVIKRIKEEFPAIQILPLDYDPDMSFANIENRLQMLIMNARNIDSPAPAVLQRDEEEKPLNESSAADLTGIMTKLRPGDFSLANVKEAAKKLFSA
jgi:predicted CoA-substrate-specific enzyme activase